MKNTKGNYPDTFYRVSLKAIIRNEKGEVLLVKEGSDVWSLPGGGMDHEESDLVALRRELYEEALIAQDFEANIIGVDSRFLEMKQAYLMWIVYEVKFDGELKYGVGADANTAEFVDPRTLKDSLHINERQVYKWTVDRSYDFLTEPPTAK